MTLSRPGGHGHYAEERRQAACRRRRRCRGLSGMCMCVCLDQVKGAEMSTGRRRSVRENDDDGRRNKAPFR